MDIFESSIFDLSPIPMWLEDYSEVKQQFDIWKKQGVQDLGQFLKQDQSHVTLCSRKIKILQVNGLGGLASTGATGEASGAGNSNVSLSDQVVNSALRYRSHAPLIDSLMGELGLQGGDINALVQPLVEKSKPSEI